MHFQNMFKYVIHEQHDNNNNMSVRLGFIRGTPPGIYEIKGLDSPKLGSPDQI